MKHTKGFSMNHFTIMQTIIATITVVLAVSVTISALSVYYISTRTSKDLVYDQASEINKQIVFNYENYTNRVEGIANLLQKKALDYDMMMDKEQVLDLFSTLENLEDSIVSVVLFDNSGQVIVSTQNIEKQFSLIALQEWYKTAIFDAKIIHFSSPKMQEIYEVNMGEVISVSKAFEYQEGNIIKSGVLLIDMNFEGLDSLSNVSNLGEKGHILILDDKDQIVYSSDVSQYGYNSKSYNTVKALIFGSESLTINGTQVVVNINTIGSTRWRIATFQDINAFEKGTTNALYTAASVIVITMLITILVAYFVAMQITNPLKKLNKAIVRFHHGNDDSKVEIEGQKEITTVITGFNGMIDRIHALMDEVIKEQESKRKTEIRALQNQINPHFLYNTLDCMIWLAEENRNKDLVDTVGALSTYFRVSLSKGKQFIPIFEELQHIESYLLIQRMRYNDRFIYKIECNQEIAELRIMKLILQPLVENAIYHGIDKDDQKSWISIHVFEEDGYVILKVTNSGYGITQEKIEEIHHVMEDGNKKGSIGMKNVYRRIKLFYGEKAYIQIASELDETTTVSICIPRDKLKVQILEQGDKT